MLILNMIISDAHSPSKISFQYFGTLTLLSFSDYKISKATTKNKGRKIEVRTTRFLCKTRNYRLKF